MMNTKNEVAMFSEKTFERVLSTACYLSVPLIFLFALTIVMSLLTTGGINTNVNNASNLLTVLLSFSLPMIVALAAVPLVFKICVQRHSAAALGLAFPQNPVTIISSGVMIVGTVAMTVILSTVRTLEISPWTIWIHFFFVAVAEEIMLRSIIMDELRFFTENKWILCLLNGVIFAFVYHSNEGFWANLLVRVPLGFVLSMVREKCGNVYPAIMMHWLYNMFVTTL